jgi:hypothetical protein
VKVADTYIEHSVIVQDAFDDPYVVDSVSVDETRLVRFKNAIHEAYSDLNQLEKDFAYALDETKGLVPKPVTGRVRDPALEHRTLKRLAFELQRLVVRWEHRLDCYRAFVHVACLWIVLQRLSNHL